MAFTLDGSGTTALDPGGNLVRFVVSPGIYVALLDYSNLDGCVVRAGWSPQMADTSNSVRAVALPDYTVDLTDPDDVHNGQLCGPCPVYTAATLDLFLVSGTPTGDLGWEVYTL